MNEESNVLPQAWAQAAGNDLFEFIRGVSYKKSQASESPTKDSVAILRAGNLQDGRILLDDLVHVPETCVRDEQRIRKGDLVIAMSSGSASVVGKVAVASVDMPRIAFGAFCGLLRPSSIVYGHWLGEFFQTREYRNLISEVAAGININNLRRDHLYELSIPVPPTPELVRLEVKIEALQERSRTARAALAEVGPLLAQFRQSLLAAAFRGDLTADWRAAHPNVEPADQMVDCLPKPPIPPRAKKASIAKIKGDCGLSVGLTDMPIPQTWAWTLLTRLGQLVTGHTPSRKHLNYWDGEIAWIGIKDARNNDGRVIEDTLQHVTELGIENSASRVLPKGTVLMTRTANSIGYSVVLGRDMATSQDLVGWILPKEVNPKFVMYLILSEHDALYRFAKGSAHPTVYFPEILSFHIALPPTDEQNEIVKRVEAMLGMIEHQTEMVAESVSNLTRLDQSILAKAFRGELVPQDPNDEPAAILLERIRERRNTDIGKNGKTKRRK